MSEYVPSFPFYDAEPYWYKNRQSSGGDSGGSVLPIYGNLSNIGCVSSNAISDIVNLSFSPIEASIIVNDDVAITGYKSQIASGLQVVVPENNLLGIAIATFVTDSDNVNVILSYTQIDPSTIGFSEGHFTMPTLSDDQALVFVYQTHSPIS